ncbi:MAG: Fe-S cluster assembly ATPase SufC, partial [Candidatus Thalassarchaeaceae archaeon]|nr:Fe-S cluster assembly ATPase SufC [Candidatus Thalassarchaeaceae archaeon]
MRGNGILEIHDLHASIQGEKILKGINLILKKGEVHALMGRNGSGKSTLAKVIMGHPDYEVTSGTITLDGQNILEMEPWKRARLGVFMSFQYPQAVPGLQVGNFLRKSVQAIRGENAPNAREFRKELNACMEKLDVDKKFLGRYVNDGFSGGEKKRLEILQLMLLQPQIAILDETDSGLDIDALRIVSSGVNQLSTSETATLLITHYQRLLNEIKPDFVHVMSNGRILKTGGSDLALELEKSGYEWVDESLNNQEVT